jgi:hypothetical protein
MHPAIKRRSRLFRLVWLVLACFGCTGPALADPGAGDACDRQLASYLRAVLADDVDQAVRHWRPADLVSAGRLEIRYTGLPLKVDGDSPLWAYREAIRSGRVSCRRERPTPVTSGALAGVMCQVIVLAAGPDTTRFPYYFAEQDGDWLLASPAMLLATPDRDHSSLYVAVHDRRSTAPPGGHELAPAQLDSCVGRMIVALGFTESAEARLARGKLGYLLLDPADVERLAGAPTVGVANLQQDVVVTSHPCHAHELAHLVVNAWLQDLPLVMLPLLQEGTAVHLGGRWGRHPRILERLGRTTLTEGLLTLDDLLTRDDFLRQPADLTYAPAGVFAGFLLSTYGTAGLRDACLAVSGEAAALSSWSADQIKTRLATTLDTSWDDLAAAFATWLATPAASGIRPGAVSATATATDTLSAAGLRLSFVDDATASEIGVTIEAVDGPPAGAILFGGDSDSDGGAMPIPSLFAEHFPGRDYTGQSHALIFTPDEAKLYDYRLQMLVALHAEGFWPSTTYVTAGGRGLRFAVARDLWPAGPRRLVEGGAR